MPAPDKVPGLSKLEVKAGIHTWILIGILSNCLKAILYHFSPQQ